MNTRVKEQIRGASGYVLTFAKWLVVAGITGILAGIVGSLFNITVSGVTNFRKAHDFIIVFLPLGGLVIAGLYKIGKVDENAGTNLIISSVRSQDKVPVLLVPLIFVAASITHLFGGSAGREGAALQLGGGIGFQVGRLFRFDAKDMSVVVICGMAGLFSALFGTPLTAAFFAMEVISVGIIHYAAFIPSLISALTAFEISALFKISPERFELLGLPKLSAVSLIKVMALASLVAVLSIVFCLVMKQGGRLFKKIMKNGFFRAFVGGAIVVVLTFIVGNGDYNGAGMDIVEKALEGEAKPMAFALKMIFTCITISAGFKGGEIVPTFFIGATFGCVAGGLLGLNPAFGAAVGLIAMFCGVVNCPMASIILSVELFGAEGILFFALACAVSYMLSGYYGLYSSQKIVYSKLRPEYININAK